MCSFNHNAITTISLVVVSGYNPAMVFEEFRSTLSADNPPEDMSPLLTALWWDAKGDWAKSHEIAQEIESPDAAWVHAYLHRKDGDEANAEYWYRRAGKPRSRDTLDAEWGEIAHSFLKA
jgi:hypothetical protein